jgi:protein involved in polysaccharide export with SLBB domain
MRVADLVRAGGGLDDAALSGRAELSRYAIIDGDVRRMEIVDIELAAALRGEPTANVLLSPFDGLFVREISAWTEQQQVTLGGEVRFPGAYPIKRGETLKSVLARAGGLTELAFPEGAAFTRDELRQREQEQLLRLTERLRRDLTMASIAGARGGQLGAGQNIGIGQSLLSQITAATAVGRLVINMPALLAGASGSENDIVLRDGDRLIVPRRSQEVTVMGEVQNVTSHLYKPSRTREDYIALSGGATRMADRRKLYVVRADGSVVERKAAEHIIAGDTIVVPLNIERTATLPLWQSITQLLFNLTVSLAAVKTF